MIDWKLVAEATLSEQWDPVAEGICGGCGGERVIVDLHWTPWGALPGLPRECPSCNGGGKHVESVQQ